MPKRLFKKLFIANRGEVCRRIASTARRLDIETATALVEVQPSLYLAGVIDEFVIVTAEKPYLNIEAMVNAAKRSGCDAIHPGFGFLSENDEFASACISAGLCWIGPNPAAIKAMASKSAARLLAESGGVPVNQALQGIDCRDVKADLVKIVTFANQAGYPVLIKAAFGGGGKGMRIVYEESKLAEAVQRCHSEAKASFANGELLVEKYIEAPRHVEVQVLGDTHGQAFAIGDRDCSLQRRHQKIIEEAPAPNLNALTRAALHQAAVKLCKTVGYDNAGTVEFLVDASVDYRLDVLQPFYFLEMNTRLQVEHPVTEEVFGMDLVEQQFRAAAGEKLADFSELKPRGWSIEARLYAEDPRENFLPSPSPVYRFEAGQDLGIRWEVGIDTTDEVSPRYDPMIAKCIATGPDRNGAIDRLHQALDQTILFGPKNNISFIQALCRDHNFRSGSVTTHYIQTAQKELLASIDLRESAMLARLKMLERLFLTNIGTKDTTASVKARTRAIFAEYKASTSPQPSHEAAILQSETISHRLYPSISISCQKRITQLESHGAIVTAALVSGPQLHDLWLHCGGVTHRATMLASTLGTYGTELSMGRNIEAPVPGKVIAVHLKSGDKVAKHQVVMVLESMKMEFEIKAGQTGTLASILVKAGDQVNAGQTLATWND